MLIDEFQRVPSVLLEIKRIVDEKTMNGEDCSGIIFILRPYHSNITSRIVKTPKMYFTDTGLKVQPGIILCMTDEMIPYDRNTWMFPVSGI